MVVLVIMEAGNRGAHRAKGKSVGLNIYLPHEQKGNIYIDPDKLITFDYFFVRESDVHEIFTGFHRDARRFRNIG